MVTYRSRRSVALLTLVFPAMLGVACASSRPYRPVSAWEAEGFSKANRRIYPDDVRGNIEAHSKSKIAWAGLVRGGTVIRHSEKITLTLEIEHHYYNWVEDYSGTNPPISLSPRGEGPFRASWDLQLDTSPEQIEQMTEKDYLVIVYGVPMTLDGDTIVLNAFYIRGIAARFYTTGLANYGRVTEH